MVKLEYKTIKFRIFGKMKVEVVWRGHYLLSFPVMTGQMGLSFQERNGKQETTAGSQRSSHVIQAISLIFAATVWKFSYEKELFYAKAKKKTVGLWNSRYNCLGKKEVLALCFE